jgi:hypothetical protein
LSASFITIPMRVRERRPAVNSDAAGATTPQPVSTPPHEPIRALLRAGKNDEAIVRLAGIVVTQPDDLDAKELLFDAFFQKRDWLPAVVSHSPELP